MNHSIKLSCILSACDSYKLIDLPFAFRTAVAVTKAATLDCAYTPILYLNLT